MKTKDFKKKMREIGINLGLLSITLMMGVISSACTPDDIVPERPIRYFPVQIITVDCDPSDVMICHDYRINGIYEQDPYDISHTLKYLNEDYLSARIQFYQYSEPISISWDEANYEIGVGESITDEKYGRWGYLPKWDANTGSATPIALILSFVNNDEYWRRESAYGNAAKYRAQINANDAFRKVIRHEFDHLFGWARVEKGVPHENYPRIPQELYDYSFSGSLGMLASDKPL